MAAYASSFYNLSSTFLFEPLALISSVFSLYTQFYALFLSLPSSNRDPTIPNAVCEICPCSLLYQSINSNGNDVIASFLSLWTIQCGLLPALLRFLFELSKLSEFSSCGCICRPHTLNCQGVGEVTMCKCCFNCAMRACKSIYLYDQTRFSLMSFVIAPVLV